MENIVVMISGEIEGKSTYFPHFLQNTLLNILVQILWIKWQVVMDTEPVQRVAMSIAVLTLIDISMCIMFSSIEVFKRNAIGGSFIYLPPYRHQPPLMKMVNSPY